LIIQAGIKRVFFSELYKDASGLLLLIKSGIEIYYIPDQKKFGD
jgi:deoxycytidylate deaminase